MIKSTLDYSTRSKITDEILAGLSDEIRDKVDYKIIEKIRVEVYKIIEVDSIRMTYDQIIDNIEVL